MNQSSWRTLLKTARWALHKTYQTSPRLCVTLIAVSMIDAVIPAILALVLGLLVGKFKDAVALSAPALAPLVLWFGVVLLLILVNAVCEIVQRYCTQRLNDELTLSVSSQVLEHASSLDLAFFEDPDSQDIMFRASQNSGQEFLKFVMDSVNTVSMLIQLISLFGVMFWIEPYFTPLLILVSIPLMVYQWKMARLKHDVWLSKTTKRRWIRYYTGLLQERLNVSTTRIFNLAPLLLERFRDTLSNIMDADRKVYARQAKGSFAAAAGFSLIFIFLIGWIGYGTITGKNTIPNFVAFWVAAQRFRACLSRLVMALNSSLGKMLFVNSMLEFLETSARIDQQAGERPLDAQGAVSMEAVGFCYAGCNDSTLHNISLSIAPGETVAFVGANGAGKTTTAKLIARFYDATLGRIKIDGKDIRELSPEWLYSQIAYVGQNPVVFEATVHENIAFGDWKRLLNEPDAIRQVATKAGIEDMIKAMPSGYETLLGRSFGEYDLSGGQWQQLAIARALAKNAAIYILDEPTSNLDMKTEHDMFARFQELTRGKTTILISHRFSSVNMADRIFVFDHGEIVEAGTHAELISVGGIYANLYNIHSRDFESKRI